MKFRVFMLVLLPVPLLAVALKVWNGSTPRQTGTFEVMELSYVPRHLEARRFDKRDWKGRPRHGGSFSYEVDSYYRATIRIGRREYSVSVEPLDKRFFDDGKVTIEYKIRRDGTLKLYRVID